MKIGGKYRIYETLGNGAFGKTHKVTNFRDPFALKEISITSCLDQTAVNTELEAHENIPRHENVVTLIDHFNENNNLYVVFEFCEPGNLNDFSITEKMDGVAITRAMRDVVNGLQHLHKHNVVHGNVKPQNILMLISHGNKPVFKISDFNLTKNICSKNTLSSAMTANQPLAKYIDSDCGLVLFWAPEFKHGDYQKAGDVFSVGAVVFALFLMRTEKKVICPLVNGEIPIAFCKQDDIESAVKSTVADNIQSIVGRMLSVDPSERPSFEEVSTSFE